MCVAFLGAAIGAIGSIASAMAQKQVADYNAKVAEMNAQAALAEGFSQAGQTRDQFAEVKGEQATALAKAGVSLESGSSLVLGLETQRREEQAAQTDIWRGRTEQTKYLNQAGAFKAEGRAAMLGGVIGAASSLVGGLSGLGQGRALQLGQAAPQVTGVQPMISAPKPKIVPIVPVHYRGRGTW